MIERIIASSLDNRLLVLIATAFLLAAGLWALRSTPRLFSAVSIR